MNAKREQEKRAQAGRDVCGQGGMKALFVDRMLQYQQTDYTALLTAQSREERLWAWRGDRACAQLAVLSADTPLDGLFVSASATAPCEDVRVHAYFVQEVRAFTGHAGWYANNPGNWMPHGKREYFPDVLVEQACGRLDAGTLQLVRVYVEVGPHAPAGTLSLSLTVGAQNTPARCTLPFTLEVLDALLPTPEEYPFDLQLWSHPYNVAYYYDVEPFSEPHLRILEDHMRLYKQLGGHGVTASIVEEAWGGQTYGPRGGVHYPSMVRWRCARDGGWQFDFSPFDRWVELNRRVGLGDKILCYSMMPWKNRIRYFDEKSWKMRKKKVNPANAEQYAQIWLPFLRAFVAHLDERGWFDCVYMGFDERHNMQTALDLLAEVKNKEGHTLKTAAAFNDFRGNADVFDRLDDASVGLDNVRANLDAFRAQVEKRRLAGKSTTLYTATEHVPNSFTKSIPAESYWTMLFAGAQNCTGFLRWAFDAWVQDPLRDSTHWSFPAGDCFLVYPDERTHPHPTSRPSLRLAELDEGLRDVNRLYRMRQDCPALAPAIAALFAGVKGANEDDYPFRLQRPLDPWGRNARWLTDPAKQALAADMHRIKEEIYALSQRYIALKKG